MYSHTGVQSQTVHAMTTIVLKAIPTHIMAIKDMSRTIMITRTITMTKLTTLALIALMVLAPMAQAYTNYPCSKSKGGVARCEGSRFKCNDGSYSDSKKVCTVELAKKWAK
jgi:hypothetical protein